MGVSTYFQKIKNEELEKVINDVDYGFKYISGVSLSELDYYDQTDDTETIGQMRDERETYLETSGNRLMTGYWDVLDYLVVQKDERIKNDTSASTHHIARGKHPIELFIKHSLERVRYFTSDEVKEVSNYIISIDFSVLKLRYNPKEFNESRVYFKHPNWEQNDIDHILSGIKPIFDFYHLSASDNLSLLVHMFLM